MMVCQLCKKEYAKDQAVWNCECGGYLTVTGVKKELHKEQVEKGPRSLWRYGGVIPVGDKYRVSMGEGFTPLIPGKDPGLYFKLDFVQPTGSYKDRGTCIVVSKLKEWGIREVIEDSSGNAGASLAAYCANNGIACEIYAPAYTSPGKLAQIAAYGAKLIKVPGTREDTTAAARLRAQEVFYASHNWVPYFIEGTKTLAYELWEQLGWRAPWGVVVPAGNGSLVLGLYKGFQELLSMKYIDFLPRIIAVQSENCCPVYQAFHGGLTTVPKVEKKPTRAEGITSAQPVKGPALLEAIRNSKGTVIKVTEEEITQAYQYLGHQGLYVEPTSATVWAAWEQINETGLAGQGTLVMVLTGSGLKAQ